MLFLMPPHNRPLISRFVSLVPLTGLEDGTGAGSEKLELEISRNETSHQESLALPPIPTLRNPTSNSGARHLHDTRRLDSTSHYLSLSPEYQGSPSSGTLCRWSSTDSKISTDPTSFSSAGSLSLPTSAEHLASPKDSAASRHPLSPKRAAFPKDSAASRHPASPKDETSRSNRVRPLSHIIPIHGASPTRPSGPAQRSAGVRRPQRRVSFGGTVRGPASGVAPSPARPTLTEHELTRHLASRKLLFPRGQRKQPLAAQDAMSDKSRNPQSINSFASAIDFGYGASSRFNSEAPTTLQQSMCPSPSFSKPKHKQFNSSTSSKNESSLFGKDFRSVTLRIPKPMNQSTVFQTLSQGTPLYDVVEIPVQRKWYGPSDLHYAFLKCIPLAAACLVLCTAFVAWGSYNIAEAATQNGVSWDETGDIIVGLFKVLIGLAGWVAVGLRLRVGLHFLSVGYNVFLVSHCVSSITQWLEWGLALGGATTKDQIPWVPTKGERIHMAWSCIALILLLTFSFLFIFGLLSSFKMVLAVGGTGWERLTYLEILEDQENQKFEEEKKLYESTVQSSLPPSASLNMLT
eukprot:Gregarina_sp_Poly_1__11283@NODE_937_length_5654_cov_79_487918_g663_i0_p2_GENE_NODE_937_length_5654_cov_79_487918_g663_i0NODE_937_length_5654_cov_79_487918_g663_i0_p2_ORF_typecomplete_len575_score63_12_NODE_937_length_5654_cov_79_487918_g663_i016963420